MLQLNVHIRKLGIRVNRNPSRLAELVSSSPKGWIQTYLIVNPIT